MMCTSSGTLVSTSWCSWSQLHVRASQKMLNRITTAATWNLDLRFCRIIASSTFTTWSCGLAEGRRGALASISEYSSAGLVGLCMGGCRTGPLGGSRT
jgi:hypothetical protein